MIPYGIATGNLDGKSPENGAFRQNAMSPSSVSSTPTGNQRFISTLQFLNPSLRSSVNYSETAPLTIFYNGSVSIFDVPHFKAEKIMKLAEKEISETIEPADSKPVVSSDFLEKLKGDLPKTRRKSLQSFLEKRKERLNRLSPYCGLPECLVDKKSITEWAHG